MKLLDLPGEDVIEDHILPFLEWNDLLRFRRVCKSTLRITNHYINAHPEVAPELEVNQQEKSMQAFLEMGIPTTKLFLNNEVSGYKFYQNEVQSMSQFLEKYGKHVRSLRVKELSVHVLGEELHFLEQLTNMVSFQAGKLGIGGKWTSKEEMMQAAKQMAERAVQDGNSIDDRLPTHFSKLKTLIIDNGDTARHIGNMISFCLDVLKTCPDLEYLCFPCNHTDRHELGGAAEPDSVVGMNFLAFACHLNKQLESSPQVIKLKEIDLRNLHLQSDSNQPDIAGVSAAVSGSFLRLCIACLENNVKLYNVAPDWFMARNRPETSPEERRPELGAVVVSLINIEPHVFPLDMSNLERIEIQKASRSCVVLNSGQTRPEWPALKTLEITLDCRRVRRISTFSDRNINASIAMWLDTNDLLHFFFLGIQRPSLQELRLEFLENVSNLPVPKSEHIVSSCYNLKKLTLVQWQGTNKALVNLWVGLPNLEEVSLEYCKNLGNVAFVGENKEEPVFLTLRNLKKLSLKGLDKMPKITDTLFSCVIRHMRLTHFLITSESAVETITPEGVKCLLDGPFSASIERFSFKDWSIARLNSEEWKELEKTFKSFQMN